VKISIVLPARNEEKILESSVKKLETYLRLKDYDYEIIIVNDASTDRTGNIADKLSKCNRRIKVMHFKRRVGKGKSISEAFRVSTGDILVFMDVDLSANLNDLETLINAIERDNYDIAIGSRLLKESKVTRPLKRKILSRIYNFMIRILFSSKVKDHQCGFKAFRRDVILDLINEVEDPHWFWDTEILIAAQRKKLKIKEIPITWSQAEESKINVLKDGFYLFTKALEKYFDEVKTSRLFLAFSILVLISILIFILRYVNLNVLIKYFLSLNLMYVLFAIAVYSASFLVRGIRYEYLMRKIGHKTSICFSTKAILVGQTVNVVTPVRAGDFVRASIFKLKKIPYLLSFSTILIERVFDLFIILVFALITSLAIGLKVFSLLLYSIFLLALLLVFLLAVILIPSRVEMMKAVIAEDFKAIMKLQIVAIVVILSLSIWFMDFLVCYFILLSLGWNDIILSALAVSVANLAKVIPITPGGIGQYEVVMFGILSIKVDKSAAFLISVMDHGLKNLITVVLGFISINLLNINIKEILKTKAKILNKERSKEVLK